jgi:hypothetical protein
MPTTPLCLNFGSIDRDGIAPIKTASTLIYGKFDDSTIIVTWKTNHEASA